MSSDEDEEIIIPKGFDRGLNFEDIKGELIDHLNKHYKNIQRKHTPREKQILVNKLCYCFIALLQLRNGSRISEACNGFIKYYNNDINKKIYVKIAKSRNKKKQTKTRYRKIVFPHDWVSLEIWEYIKGAEEVDEIINNNRLCKRVLDYLLTYCSSNTHSLRYAYINHLLTDLKIEMNTVSKIVGHVNCNQLVTYTSNQKVEDALDMDI